MKFQLSSDPSQIDRLHALLRESFQEQSSLDPARAEEIVLAVHEAFTNILRHAYEGDSSKPIWIEVTADSKGLLVELIDCGFSFDPTLYPSLDLEHALTELPEGGYGLFFVCQIAESVKHHREDGRNHLLLRFPLVKQVK